MDTKILLIGAGPMAIEYAKVLGAMGINFTVVGRGTISAIKFQEETGFEVVTGGLENQPTEFFSKFNHAIVAVDVEGLHTSTIFLMVQGIKSILVEKPAGLTTNDVICLNEVAFEKKCKVLVAYNRRFYTSFLEAEKMIKEDGGVKSFSFEFTERSHFIRTLNKSAAAKNNWFFANSSHVIDMAFALGGQPQDIKSFSKGGLDWHPKASIFAGCGISKEGSLFTYSANWESAGGWGVEILTKYRRLIFKPLERLKVQKVGENYPVELELDYELDILYKPGIYKMVENFINGDDKVLSIGNHSLMMPVYEQILHGNI